MNQRDLFIQRCLGGAVSRVINPGDWILAAG
jgi:hypothetical protein